MLKEQWILASLLGIVWCGDMLVTIERSQSGELALLTLPPTVMCVLALLGWRKPSHCGVLAAGVLGLSSAAMSFAGVYPYAAEEFGFVQPAEDAAGVLLVLYVFWKRPIAHALPVAGTLVLACLWALLVRPLGAFDLITLGFGFLQLALAAGTGIYLGGWRIGSRPAEADTPLRALVRRQWPMMAMLAMLVFGEVLLGASWYGAPVLPFLGCLTLAGLAVIAPARPQQAALLGAFTLAVLTVLMLVFNSGSYPSLISNIPLSVTAAGTLLVIFSTRYSPPRSAARSTAALVGSALFAAFLLPSVDGTTLFIPALQESKLVSALVLGGLLLVAAVGTGLYFRSRDEEQARSVQAAISHAQQNERLALARELHDIVAHHVTGIVVQAQAAQLAGNPQTSATALERIAGAGTEALTAMRRLVSSMRGAPSPDNAQSPDESHESPDISEQATMDLEADLQVLVTRANEVFAGERVELVPDLSVEVRPEVARSALRVVQEALTNVGKHASDADRVVVLATTTDTHLHLRISDNGWARASPIGGSGGYGLVGMRERVELLGGSFRAGPSMPVKGPTGFGLGERVGWEVEAWLPFSEEGTA